MQRHHVAGRDHADHRGGATHAQHLERLLSRALEPDGFERIVHAAAGQLDHLGHSVAVAGVDHIGSAELARQLELGIDHVHGDDTRRTCDGGAVDAGQTNAAAADDRNRGSRLHSGGMDDRTHAGGDTAADQRSAIHGHVLANLHHRVLVHQHHFRKRPQLGKLGERHITLSQPRLLFGAPLHFGFLAQRQMAREALLTMTAEHRQAGDDVVARLDVVHVTAHRFHHPGALVAEHHGQLARVGAVVEMHVTVADTGRLGAHQHLARAGLGDLDVLDLHGNVHFTKYSGFHGVSPSLLF